ncbi:Poly(U)-specific endoribonuclease -like protein [Trichinella nelsoni]|uniref:Poly(U)-specific endoribonuclease-like protein n=1 Tax=Trichinella nelsoni TaxID=6336 RepID=A0A0V0S4R5_9BILA|nr:Poly(U)-specific endoribonuclease -like protein [Trichinella nelsoni]
MFVIEEVTVCNVTDRCNAAITNAMNRKMIRWSELFSKLNACYYLLALSLMSIFDQWKKVLSTFALTLRPYERKEQPEDDSYDKQDTAILKFQKTIKDEEIKILVNRMREADENRAKDDDYKLNYQQRTTPHEEEDLAPLPLFTWVNEQLLNRSTYRAYLDLVPLFHPEVSIDEDWNAEEKKKIYAFLDEIMHTKVFNLMWEFLLEKKLVPEDKFQFKNLLFTQWFGLYTRSHGHLGSSGFEHVFIGEWRKHIVEGQHYWLRFYSLEKQGHINYKGWLLHDKNVAATIHYDWRSHHKEIGGFLIGSSPEFDFSLFTLCFNAKRGQNACKVLIDEFPIHVTSFRIEHKPFINVFMNSRVKEKFQENNAVNDIQSNTTGQITYICLSTTPWIIEVVTKYEKQEYQSRKC